MSVAELSPLSWVALAIMAASLAAAVTKRFMATGALLLGNIAVFVLVLFGSPATVVHTPWGPQVPSSSLGMTQVQADLGLFVPNLLEVQALGFLQFASSMFVHYDLWHIFGNMIFLWAFGMPFEERIGSRRFIAIYLVSGAFGALAQIAVDLYTGTPGYLMGASAAIFGIMCAFATKYPNQVVPVPVPVFFFIMRFPMRVVYGAMLWVGLSILYAYAGGSGDDVAHMAHLGGGVAGALMAVAFLRHVNPIPGRGPIAIDLAALGTFAQDVPTKQVLAHMRANHDEPDVFQAWLDKFFRTATCPTCQHRVMPRHRGEVVCTQGHTFDVRQDKKDKLAPAA